MKRSWMMVVPLVVVAISLVLCFIAPGVAAPTASAPSRVVEYKVILSPNSMALGDMQAILDLNGKEGWDLVTINNDRAIFKR